MHIETNAALVTVEENNRLCLFASTVLIQEREDLHRQSLKLKYSVVRDIESEAAVDRAILRKLIDAPEPLETEALLAAIYDAKVCKGTLDY